MIKITLVVISVIVVLLVGSVYVTSLILDTGNKEDFLTDTQTTYIENSKPNIENTDHREALLISNNEYKYMSNLKDISSNLSTLDKTLKDLNFNVKIKNNLNDKQLKQAINQFKDRLAKNTNSIGFLYYAGHGCQLDNVGYLVPTNVNIKKKIDIEFDAMNINKMLKELDSAGNLINMIFLDACRNIPTGVRGEESTRGLAQAPKTPQGTLLVYATEAGETADDNVKFINALINNISQSNQQIEMLGSNISRIVAKKTNYSQIPEVYAKLLPKNMILKQTTNTPKKEIEKLETPPKVEKKKLVKISPPEVIEKKYSLTIKTNPTGATVKILNIRPKYKDGILLIKGNYKIEVSKKGYAKLITNLYLKDDISKNITLTKIIIEKAPVKSASFLGGHQKAIMNSYYINVGTYRDISTVIPKVKKNNFNYSLYKPIYDKTLTRVLVGPFFSHNQASSQLAKVKTNILTGAYVTKAK